jgi:hypothetical protein
MVAAPGIADLQIGFDHPWKRSMHIRAPESLPAIAGGEV